MNIKRITSALTTGFMLALAVPAFASAANSTKVVTPSDMQGWNFFQEVATGSGAMVSGPEAPPFGSGSAQLTVDSTGRQLLLNNDFAGTKLKDVTELKYSTYRETGSDPLAISLQLDIDTNSTDSITAWQGRLVYEPYFTNAVPEDEWKTWNTMDNAAAGNWWFSGAPGNAECPQSNPCTWNEVITKFPDAAIRVNNATDTAGFVNFKAGGPWAPGFVGNVDAFSIGIQTNVTIFDFEQTAPAAAVPTGLQFRDGNVVIPCGGTTSSSRIIADWNDSANAVKYRYSVNGPNAYATTPYVTSGADDPTTSERAGDFTDGEGKYTYRVAAFNSDETMSTYSSDCSITFDSTPGPVLTYPDSKDDCKNNDWKTFTGVEFDNQGECVSYVNKLRTKTYTLNSNNPAGLNVPTVAGDKYRVRVLGTWTNRAGEVVDAECTSWQDKRWKNSVEGGNYNANLLDVQINEAFVNWGSCQRDHKYNRMVIANDDSMNLRVFDGDTTTNQQINDWFADNKGTLTVKVTSHPKN